jgi:hypothetical protein
MNVRAARSDNKLGFMGVQKNRNKYRARIRFNGKVINLGGFDTPEEAHAVYLATKLQMHPTFSGVRA